ncbi:hypothetical protein [Rhodococcus koreensis]
MTPPIAGILEIGRTLEHQRPRTSGTLNIVDTPSISIRQSTVFRNADVPAGTANTSRPDTLGRNFGAK